MTSQKGTMKNGVEILIVEDSPSQAEQLKHILEQHDYSVSVAINGKEALALINKHKPTIVISDIIMPEMDGYELCRQIKADENLTNIPVILLTSLSDPEDIVRGLECGADNFVTKPYDERYILSHIQHILISKELRKSVRAEVDIEIFFAGKKYFINSERRQILDLLLSTYETAVQKNVKLIKAHDELRRLNEDLEKIVEERTAALTAEIAERKQANEVLRETLAHLSKKNRYETIISTVTHDVHQSINLQEVLENAVESMSENIELVGHIGIYLVEGEEAVLKAQRGLTDRYIKQAERIPYPKGATWETIIKGKPSYVADTNQDTVIGPAGREMGIKSYLSMPIHFEGKTAGCINITSLQKNAFDEEELKLLEIVAKQIGVAINNARQAEKLRRSEEALRENFAQLTKKNSYEAIMSAVTRGVHQSINLQEVLENAVDAMSKNINGVGHVAIHLVEGEEAVMKAHRGHPDWFVERVRRIPYPKGFTWNTIIEGKTRYCPDVDQDTFIGPAGREVGTKSYLSIPVLNEGKTVGCINVHSFQKNAFDEE